MEKKLKQIIENNTIYPVTSTNFINPKTSTKCNTMISKCFNNININKIQEKPNNFRNSIVSKTNYVNKNTTLNIDYKSNHSTFDKIESRLNFQYKDGYEEFMNENEIKFKRKNNSVMRSNQNYDHSNIIIREDFKNDYNYHNNYSKITSANDFSYISNKLDKLKDTLNQKLNWSPNNNMLNPST